VDRIYWIANVTSGWTGPISLAVLVPGIELQLTRVALKYLHKCVPDIMDRVSVQLVSDNLRPPTILQISDDQLLSEMTCSDIHGTLRKLVEDNKTPEMANWPEKFIYPQQLLRNVAKQGCLTKYVMLIDVDMIPYPTMAADLRSFLFNEINDTANECEKCAFVIPVYEISETVAGLPVNKKQLLGMIKEKKARPFHEVISKKNSGSTNSTMWQNYVRNLGKNELTVAYNVTNFILQYEPIYVARGNVPAFDERFQGFGCTRWTQVCLCA
jgi:N-acetyllactosaminide beta-1,3-N-acetylglucosaminyltransferase